MDVPLTFKIFPQNVPSPYLEAKENKLPVKYNLTKVRTAFTAFSSPPCYIGYYFRNIRLLNILALVLEKIEIHTECRKINFELIYAPITRINQPDFLGFTASIQPKRIVQIPRGGPQDK